MKTLFSTRFYQKNSISFQLFKLIFGSYIAIAVIVTLLHLLMEFYNIKDSISREQETYYKIFSTPVATALWEFNTEQLEAEIEAISALPSVVGVLIEDSVGETKFLKGLKNLPTNSGDEAKKQTQFFSQLFWKKFPLHYEVEGERIGFITFYSSTDVIVERLRTTFVAIMIQAFFKSLALWLVFVFFSNKVLATPLLAMTHVCQRVKMDNLEDAKFNFETSTKNELSFLGESFNNMIKQLLGSRQQLDSELVVREELSDQLQEINEDFNNIIQKSTQGMLIIDNAGVVQFSNQSANFLLKGSTNDNLKGKPFPYKLDTNSKEVSINLQDDKKGVGEVRYELTMWKKQTAFLVSIIDVTERKKSEKDLDTINKTQIMLNSILQMSLADISIREILDVILEKITTCDWMSIRKKGAIFLADTYSKKLELKAHRDMSAAIIENCSTLLFGTCLCGKTAISKDVEFCSTDCNYVDSEPSSNMCHCSFLYCCPILDHNDNLLGLINIYVEEGSRKEEKVVNFLKTISRVISGIIQNKRMENEKQKVQESLLHSSKMASLGTMAGGIAHEINNPVAIIKLNAMILCEMIQTNEVDIEVLEKSVSVIEETTGRIGKIVQSLLNFSREKDEIAKEMDYASVKKIVEDTLNICFEKFKSSGVHIEMSDIPESLHIFCFEGQISQVLLNLLNNAFDAILDLDEKWIKISYEDTKDFVKLSVVDSGKGVPQELQEKIMVPFFTTKEVGKGTGIGLGLCQTIMDNHNGELILDTSSPNTKFVLNLPKKVGV